jgi:hypothetical protein
VFIVLPVSMREKKLVQLSVKLLDRDVSNGFGMLILAPDLFVGGADNILVESASYTGDINKGNAGGGGRVSTAMSGDVFHVGATSILSTRIAGNGALLRRSLRELCASEAVNNDATIKNTASQKTPVTAGEDALKYRAWWPRRCIERSSRAHRTADPGEKIPWCDSIVSPRLATQLTMFLWATTDLYLIPRPIRNLEDHDRDLWQASRCPWLCDWRSCQSLAEVPDKWGRGTVRINGAWRAESRARVVDRKVSSRKVQPFFFKYPAGSHLFLNDCAAARGDHPCSYSFCFCAVGGHASHIARQGNKKNRLITFLHLRQFVLSLVFAG